MTLSDLGFKPRDFEVFAVEDFGARMELLYRHVRPKLVKLGNELAPELSRKLHLEFFPHVAKHARRILRIRDGLIASDEPQGEGREMTAGERVVASA